MRQYLKLSSENLLETHQIERDPTRSCRDLARSQQIQPNIDQISTDPAKITAPEIKTKTDWQTRKPDATQTGRSD